MNPNKLRLGVNVDHVATLREARKAGYPDPVVAAGVAVKAGADGITVHLREDRRHIQERDVMQLLEKLPVPLNLEMAATEAMITFAEHHVSPHVCLVPEKRMEITTEGGLDVISQRLLLVAAVDRLHVAGSRVSLFIDPEPAQIDAAQQCAADVVELHTGAYAETNGSARTVELERLRHAAQHAATLGLEVHAGHGLTVGNVTGVAAIPQLAELNIGHSIVARAIFVGLAAAVEEMRAAMQKERA